MTARRGLGLRVTIPGALLGCVLAALPFDPPRAQSAGAADLVPGKGSDLTMARCAPCHEIMHVTRSRLTRAEWQDNLKVMLARGAQFTPEEFSIMVDYLSAYYGRNDDGTPREAPPPEPAQAGYGMAATPGASGGEGGGVDRLLATGMCLSCHAVDRKLVGPGFGEIAAKFAGDSAAPSRLARKIREGGSGVWGAVPMPPNSAFSDDEVRRLVEWVLSRKPG